MKNSPLKIFLLIAVIAVSVWFWHQGKVSFSSLKQVASVITGQSDSKELPQKGHGGPMPVGATPVEVKDLAVVIDAIGNLSAGESAEIRAEIAGVIKSINFLEGRFVKKGDSLVDIDDELILAELMKAEATYKVRQALFERNNKLKLSGYISKQEWEQSRGNLQETLADVESARIRLGKTKVRVPFDGLAGLRDFSVGDYVQVGQLLTTLDAVDPVKITFSVPEKNYGSLMPEQKVSFSVDAWPEEIFTGEIYAVSPRINRNTRNFDIRATISNVDGRLSPGMFAKVNIVIDVHKGALLVPEQAIIPRGNDNFVFVVREGKAVLQKIRTG
ncbi:MAG: efflux RND transporter periplasmic adaptor subunit, partial [Alphaproteobacteria bacterium]|nr:efflux RND transporter periplasmic adaptor subunit [Alphaproteobacteria bacterium]